MNIPIRVTEEEAKDIRNNADNRGVRAILSVLARAKDNHLSALLSIPVDTDAALWALRGGAQGVDALCRLFAESLENKGSNPGTPDEPTPGQTIIQNTD
jgi:hypothetical protein